MAIKLIAAVVLLTIIQNCYVPAASFSLSKDDYARLVLPNCFRQNVVTNADLVFGQEEPTGLSIENLISLIERLELKYPQYSPASIIGLFLKRFHHDGVHLQNGKNTQSPIEFSHGQLTEAILSQKEPRIPSLETDVFTEGEKCNLFFTLSHAINKTALPDEPLHNTRYVESRAKFAKSQPVVAPKKDTKPATTTVPTPKGTQSKFLDAAPKVAGKQKRQINSERMRESKTPREYGVVSFLGNRQSAIVAHRVLLGLYVGFAQPSNPLMSQVLQKLPMPQSLKSDVTDEVLETLYAVTLADLMALTSSDDGFNNVQEQMFGAEGEWNTSACQVAYTLKTPGYWVTTAELRGGLDGFNLGYELNSYLKAVPTLTASQALRFYYSKFGLSTRTGICTREYFLNNDIQKDLSTEAKKYGKLWNAVKLSNSEETIEIDGFINQRAANFLDVLKKAAKLNEDELLLCANPVTSDIQSRPCESSVDMFFLLDKQERCDDKSGYCKAANVVSALTKGLPFGRNVGGTVSVLYNAKSVTNPSLVDDEKRPIVMNGLYATLFNSTSNQCASCRALYSDVSNQETMTNRNQLLESINTVLEQFESGRANQSGVPGKVFVWMDSGSLQPIPTDKIQQVQYTTLKRQLLSVQRDVTFFGVAKNVTNLKDIVTVPENLVTLDDNYGNENALFTLRQKVCSAAPSVFQYTPTMSNNCSQASNNVLYEGFITPGYKQYWVMQPDSFIRSDRVQLSFQADNASIQVCYDRAPKPEARSENCKRAEKKGVLTWSIPNPCPQSFEKCMGMYFTVSVENADSLGYCLDKRCAALNQVRWTLSHTGARCNSAVHLLTTTSVILLIVSTIVCIFVN